MTRPHELLRIGELAARTGLTVRTLHHYHDVGLLVPARHVPGSQRRYGPDDVARLQRIQSLRALGLSLAEIGAALDRPGHSLLEVVERHRERVARELDAAQRLRARLDHVAGLLRARVEVPLDDLLSTLEETVMFEKYYTPEQMDDLKKRHDEVGAERIAAVQQEWARLFADLAAAQAAGEGPDSERVLALGRQAEALIEEFTGGDAGIRASLANLYRGEGGGAQVMAQHGMDVQGGTWGLLQQAMAAAREDGGDGGGTGA